MRDADQTIVSGGKPAKPKRTQPWLLAGVGCLLLIFLGLFGGGALYLFRDRLDEAIAGLTGAGQTPTVVAPTTEPIPTATPVEVTESTATATREIVPTETATATATPTASLEPHLSDITFAEAADKDYNPINPGITFTVGITEIHAIFDYNGMSPNFTWERVWYLDEVEILHNTAAWSGDEAGRFDYFIDAGGDPLTPGEWVLELYVEGELLATGSFIIEGEAIAAIAATEEPTVTVPTATAIPIPTVTPTPTPAYGGGTFQLAFTKWDGGQHNLFVADTNGNNERFIFGRAAGPSWTPDKTLIFFYGEEGIDRQVIDGNEYVFDGISNGVVAIAASPLPGNVSEAVLFQEIGWKEGTARTTNVSPDGQMVAFEAKPGGGAYRIFFLGTQDNRQFQFQILGEHADWSPDSKKLVYRSGRDGKTGLWISNRDDSGHTLITAGGSDSFPAWSPDGTTIAFSRDEGGNVDIYTINPDGANLKRLTDAPGPDTLPVYTPTGDIVFRSARTGAWGIWKMSGSGGNQIEIVPNAGVGPDWTFSRMSVR